MPLFSPPNSREHQVSPIMDLKCYYAYAYHDGPLADAKYTFTGQNGHQRKEPICSGVLVSLCSSEIRRNVLDDVS